MDRLIQRYDVYKVETISSTYMCVSGIPIRNGQRHVTEIARMSLDIIAAAQQFRIASMPEVRLSLRIGAHTGKAATLISWLFSLTKTKTKKSNSLSKTSKTKTSFQHLSHLSGVHDCVAS